MIDVGMVDEVDDLPSPTRPALAAIRVQTIAEHAARTGLDLARYYAPGNPALAAERAHAEVQRIADRVLPARDSDESPDAWYRRGVRDGIVTAWEGRTHEPPTIGVSDLELYCAGWAHASSVVQRVIKAVRHGG